MELFPYQKEALKRMKDGCILCGGVGSGKSITALSYYKKKAHTLPLYIITTAKKRDEKDWEKEMCRFVGMEAHVDSWNNIKKYADTRNAFFIFDEQRVVGSGAWVKAFLKIARANRWILLSATPGDTWMDYIPVFVANRFYRNRSEFIRRHVIYSRFAKFPKVDRYIDQGILMKLKRRILVDMDYTQPAVREEREIKVGYDKSEYKSLMKNRFNPKKKKPMKNASELCYCLRECVNSDKTRIESVKHLVAIHKRVIIFYNFNYELEILLNMGFPKVACWNGKTHDPLPEGDEWVYLVQYTAGAEGWNCITTNVIIFYSLNYSYKIMEQARGRIDRVNTPYKYLYYYYIRSMAPIDLAIIRALKAKKKFNEKEWAGENVS